MCHYANADSAVRTSRRLQAEVSEIKLSQEIRSVTQGLGA
jgi:hypothetical protein